MSTAGDLIRDALLDLAVIDAGEAVDAATGADCLRRLNSMLNTWSAEGLMIYTFNRAVYSMVIGQASYTLGTGGNFNADRPIWFNMASVIPGSSPSLEIPIDIMSDEDWQTVPIKTLASTFPVCIHPRGDYPLNTIDVWPVPTASCSLVIYAPSALSEFALITSTASFPPGYEEAIRSNLAVRVALMFGRNASADLIKQATTSKNTLKAQNLVSPVLRCDPSYCGNSVGPSIQAIRSKGYVCD